MFSKSESIDLYQSRESDKCIFSPINLVTWNTWCMDAVNKRYLFFKNRHTHWTSSPLRSTASSSLNSDSSVPLKQASALWVGDRQGTDGQGWTSATLGWLLTNETAWREGSAYQGKVNRLAPSWMQTQKWETWSIRSEWRVKQAKKRGRWRKTKPSKVQKRDGRVQLVAWVARKPDIF